MNETKTIRKKVRLPMYNCVVELVFTADLKKEVNRLSRKHKEPEDFEGGAEGIMLNFSIGHYYLIVEYKYLSHNTLAHELHHAVCQITTNREIKEEEAQAWLAGFLAENVYQLLKSKNIEITK